MMYRAIRTLAAVALALGLLGPAHAQTPAQVIVPILTAPAPGPTLSEVTGLVNYVNTNHFTVLGPNNQFVRVMVKPGDHLDPNVQAGVTISCSLSVDNNGQYVLESIDSISPLLAPPPAPTP